MEFSRRQFIEQLSRRATGHVVAACEAVGRSASVFAQIPEPPAQKWLRPPGALDEPDFLAACTRCTDCRNECPYDSIRRLGPEFGSAAGTPVIIPDESPCYLCEDMPCISVCEPGALQTVERQDVSMGLAVLETEKCYVSQGQPCDYCFSRCPLKETAISRTSIGIPVINDAGCVGCGVCAYLCPANALSIDPF